MATPAQSTADSKIVALQAEISALESEIAQLELEKKYTPKELLQAILGDSGALLTNTELFVRAQESESAFLKALAMELKLYDHYSPADAERVALGAVETMQLSPSGLVAARFLGQRITPALRSELERAFSGKITEVSPAGNWLAAAALYEAGDSSFMDHWSAQAAAEISRVERPNAAVVAYLTACSLWPLPESNLLLLEAAESKVAAIRKMSIPGLQRASLEEPRAREALEVLVRDPDASVKEKAELALKVLSIPGR